MILQLTGVGSWGVNDPAQVTQGAIDASTPTGKYINIPRAHPVYGKTPPYFQVSYSVITDWGYYELLVLGGYTGLIIINTHGEILPVPTGYSKEDWLNRIANNMVTQRWTWVNVGGYPFNHAWYQGATDKTPWGPAGFQTLMSHIGLGNVEIPTSLPISGFADLYGAAPQYLSDRGWSKFHFASHVDLYRPLKKSDFANYVILPLYRKPYDTEEYWEGAIIAFLKAGTRLSTTNGFGAFVHLGTSQTYDDSFPQPMATNRDYYAGYVTAAAAIWTESEQFESQSTSLIRQYPGGTGGSEIHISPVISGYHWDGGNFTVRVFLGIYGGLVSPSSGLEYADYIVIDVFNLPSTFQIQADTYASKSGTGTGLQIRGLEKESLLGYATPAAKWLLGKALGPVFSGVMLFSDYLQMATRAHPTDRGVDRFDSYVHFSYYPQSSRFDQGGFRVEEFQTLIALDFRVPIEAKGDWVIAPFEVAARLVTTRSELQVEVDMGRSMAMWFDPYNHVTLFSEDFEHDLTSWNAGDENNNAGNDYWGIVGPDIAGKASQAAWCAAKGKNSVEGDRQNTQVRKYDKSMDAYLTRQLDLRPFRYAELSYNLFTYYIKTGDYLAVEYYPRTGGAWTLVKSYAQDPAHAGWFTDTANISNDATGIRFRFHSNDDSDIDLGPSIDNIELRGVIHNDASSLTDAGNLNSMSNAISISASSSIVNYAGYLDISQPDRDDWYKFPAMSGQVVYATLTAPSGSDFRIKLTDPYGGPAQESLTTINYTVPSGLPTYYWYIDIFTVSGFGQYDFDIKVYGSGSTGGGGGCPFSYIWNGSEYLIDNNLLRYSELDPQTDVVDQYNSEQSLVPKNGKYALQIRELEREHSYLDQVKLFAFDHDADVHIGVSPDGKLLTYKTPYSPVSATDQYGNDELSSVDTIGGSYYEGHAGDYLLVDFGNLKLRDSAKLLLRADPKWVLKSIYVQVQDSENEWNTVATIAPRMRWAMEIIDMSSYLPDMNGHVKVKLYFTGNHRLDFVGLDTSKQASFQTHQTNLLAATHSVSGDAKPQLLQSDDTYAELSPGDQIELTFSVPKMTGETRSFILYTEGRYYTIP